MAHIGVLIGYMNNLAYDKFKWLYEPLSGLESCNILRMVIIMTEDVVNEICKFCVEKFGDDNCFGLFEGRVFLVDDNMDSCGDMRGYYAYGEDIPIDSREFEESEFSSEIREFLIDMVLIDERGLVFSIDSNTIEMYLCEANYNDLDGFLPELEFSFKKTFDKDLFD